MAIEVRTANARFRTAGDGRDTRHSFSFGAHYDPGNVGFGVLVALNDERLGAKAGYPDHPHADVEIVTWVVEGALHHRDDAGHDGVLEAGETQVLSAGSGVVHTEFAAGVRTRFVQSWIRPDEPGGAPAYARHRVGPTGATPIAAGAGDGPRIRAAGATCTAVVLSPGEAIALPDAARSHVFAIDGRVMVGERALGPGDAARLTGEGGRPLRAEEAARLLVWSLA